MPIPVGDPARVEARVCLPQGRCPPGISSEDKRDVIGIRWDGYAGVAGVVQRTLIRFVWFVVACAVVAAMVFSANVPAHGWVRMVGSAVSLGVAALLAWVSTFLIRRWEPSMPEVRHIRWRRVDVVGGPDVAGERVPR